MITKSFHLAKSFRSDTPKLQVDEGDDNCGAGDEVFRSLEPDR